MVLSSVNSECSQHLSILDFVLLLTKMKLGKALRLSQLKVLTSRLPKMGNGKSPQSSASKDQLLYFGTGTRSMDK